jgi:Extensin-like protein C-terminus
VLGPDSDWYHEDHIHLDLAERRNGYRICQWDVLDPLPKIAPLLPAGRPEEAPPREVAREEGKGDAGKGDDAKSDEAKGDAPKPDDGKPTAGKTRAKSHAKAK